MLDIFLAGPPMGKQRVRVTKTGHAFTPEKTVSYEGRLALAAQEAMRGRPLLEGPLSVSIVALMPIAKSKPKKWREAALAGEIKHTKKPDWDNIGKMIDALNMIVWVDDAQIFIGSVSKYYSTKPMLAIRVEKVEDAVEIPSWVHNYEGEPDEGIFL